MGVGPGPYARQVSPTGPPKHSLTAKEQLSLTEGNWLAISAANLLSLAHAHKVSWIYETPEPVEEVASMLHLREFASLASLPGVSRQNFDQCMFGAASTKPTALLSFGVDLSAVFGRCTHPLREQHATPSPGRKSSWWAAHPPIIGRKSGTNTYATAAASAYPGELNRAFVWAIVTRGRRCLPSQGGSVAGSPDPATLAR